MAAKELKFSDDARSRLKAGIDVLADTLKPTLGPRGRNIIMRVNGQQERINRP